MLKRLMLLAALIASPALAHDYKLGDLQIDHPFARATAGRTGGAFLTIKNAGAGADRLIAAASPVAPNVELHTTVKDGDVMRMRPVAAIDVPAGETVRLQPGGLHVMLIGLAKPLKAGEKFPLTLTFEKAGKVEVTVDVDVAGTMAPAHSH
jgi:copper(I)-binding protein